MKQNAERGDVEAQAALGYYYFEIEDYENAYYWLELAADQGHPSAPTAMALIIMIWQEG